MIDTASGIGHGMTTKTRDGEAEKRTGKETARLRGAITTRHRADHIDIERMMKIVTGTASGTEAMTEIADGVIRMATDAGIAAEAGAEVGKEVTGIGTSPRWMLMER